MWPDNETTRDFLNFSGVAETVAEIIIQARGRPISIGVSGAWGSGKSSMIKLTQSALDLRSNKDDSQEFVFVEFNAWLYQGYDDARAALMEVIANKLEVEAKRRNTAIDRAKDLARRVRWLRVAKLIAGSTAALTLGIEPMSLFAGLTGFSVGASADTDTKKVAEIKKNVSKIAGDTSRLLTPDADHSPPKEIQALRDSFEETLESLGVTLVVLIDDLDRCLPETTISTLEAFRLFLFLKNTAFVIAADKDVIKHAVRRHFEGIDDDALVANYFDKLIQVPIRVPPLGTQEVRAYMMLLFVENSVLEESVREAIRAGVCRQLRRTWQGARVDRAFVQSLHETMPDDLIGKFDTADRLAPLMTTASGISGNPRLIKRFLNALSIRMAISKAQGVGVDEAVLAKLLLFERVGDPKAYLELISKVSSSDTGKPVFLRELEEKANAGAELKLDAPWNDPFITEWLTLPPALADTDLRGALYVSREHAPLITPEDRLSSEAAELLAAMLEHPDMTTNLKDRIAQISRLEITILMDRLLDRARREQEWGVPPILEACIVIVDVDPGQGSRLAAFLQERPIKQIKPSIVPKIGDQPWAKSVFEMWSSTKGISRNVKAAIKKREEDGNFSIK